MIARMRRKLVRLVEAFAKDKSTKLPGVDDPGLYRGHRAGNFVAPAGKPFREAYEEQMRQPRQRGAALGGGIIAPAPASVRPARTRPRARCRGIPP